MGKEIELKFAATAQQLQRLRKLRILRPGDGPLSTAELVSVYYDTDAHALKRHGVALRVRKIGSARIQAVKSRAPGAALERGEWETPLRGDEPDFDAVDETPLRPLLTKKLKRKLKPQFETRIQRTTLPLRFGSSEIEIAFDSGTIRAGSRSAPVSEVELELKHGSAAELFALARSLQRSVPIRLELRTKAERGYTLADRNGAAAAQPEKPELQPDGSADQAFQAVARLLLQQIAAQEPALRKARPDGVHQMRIALRRLRAAISLFAELLAGAETEHIKRELRWLTGRLAPARDLHVMRTKLGRRRVAPSLLAQLGAERSAAFQAAKATIDSSRYRLLLLDVLHWIEAGDWTRRTAPPSNRADARSFAEAALRERADKVLKRGKKLETMSADQRHRLRIAIKKLYYAIGFFETLFEKERKLHKRLIRFKIKLKELLNVLGALNDITVHRALARKLARSAPRKVQRAAQLAAISLAQRDQAEVDALLDSGIKLGRKLAKATPFRD